MPLYVDTKFLPSIKSIVAFVNKKRIHENTGLSKYAVERLDNINEIFEELFKKINLNCYGNMLNSVRKAVTANKESFYDLCLEDKCEVIYEMLILFQNNSLSAKLSLIGGQAKTSRVRITNSLKDNDKMSIIHQSPSGIFEHEIELTSL